MSNDDGDGGSEVDDDRGARDNGFIFPTDRRLAKNDWLKQFDPNGCLRHLDLDPSAPDAPQRDAPVPVTTHTRRTRQSTHIERRR